MDDTIELVARHCGKHINDYQRCLLANQGRESECNTYRAQLSSCAANSVPLLATVKERCKQQIQAYDLCLKQGEHDNDELITLRCTSALRNLHMCTEAVRREGLGSDRHQSIGIKS